MKRFFDIFFTTTVFLQILLLVPTGSITRIGVEKGTAGIYSAVSEKAFPYLRNGC